MRLIIFVDVDKPFRFVYRIYFRQLIDGWSNFYAKIMYCVNVLFYSSSLINSNIYILCIAAQERAN